MSPEEVSLMLFAQLILQMMQTTINLLFCYRRMRARQRRAYYLAFGSSRARFAQTDNGCLLTEVGRRTRLRRAIARIRSPRAWWVYPKIVNWWENIVLGVWDDEQWIRRFRMTRGTFFEIADALRARLLRQSTNMRDPIPPEKKVAVAIWCLSTGSGYRQAGDQFGLGVSTVHSAFLEVCFCLEIELLRKTVCLGTRVGTVMDGFAALGFPHCVGAIDGTHIPICAPGGSPEQYGNRKKFSSMLVQGTVDSRGVFVDVEVGWSGKCHDAFVFRHSSICAAMDAGTYVPGNPCLYLNGVCVPPLIIGDGAYPLRSWLMKPYGSGAQTAQDREFDRVLSRARNVVERAYGRLKSRWRILSRRLCARECNLVTIISACIVLHNICEEKGHVHLCNRPDPNPVRAPPEGEEPYGRDKTHLEKGKIVRDALRDFIIPRV